MGISDARDLLQLFGSLRRLSMPQDPATGKIIGHGYCQFENPMDSIACLLALNGFLCGANRLKLEMMQEEPAVHAVKSVAQITGGESQKPSSVTSRILSNPVLASQIRAGREMGARPSTVVQMINAVYPEDLIDDQEYLSLAQEVKDEAAKFGQIEQVRIPRPRRDLSHVEGCGKIFVQFRDLRASRKFQLEMNGRLFDNSRVICAAFYPLDRFLQGKYTLHSR
jgi:splicing factor U2AF subunit